MEKSEELTQGRKYFLRRKIDYFRGTFQSQVESANENGNGTEAGKRMEKFQQSYNKHHSATTKNMMVSKLAVKILQIGEAVLSPKLLFLL